MARDRRPSAAARSCIAGLLLLVSPALAVGQGAGAPAEVVVPAQAALQAALDDFVERTGVPAASFAAVLPSGERLALTAGVTNRADGRALEPADRMLGGSTGKTFFAALALALVEERKLSLEDAVGDWLGGEEWYERVPNAAELDLASLLRHQSGIPEYYDRPGFVEALLADPDRRWKPAELLAWIYDLPPLFEVGKGWSYADTNYILLGLVLEKAGEEEAYAAIERRFLRPLELGATAPSTSRELAHLVCGETRLWSAQGLEGPTVVDGRFVLNPQFEWAGGGFVTNPSDLAQWAKALYGGRVLGEGSLARMLESVPARTGPGERYGLGLQVFPTRFGPMYGHGGFFPGYLTCMGYLPERGLALALQVSSDDLARIRRPLQRVLEEWAALLLDAAPR